MIATNAINAIGEPVHRPIRKANPGVFQSDQAIIEQFVVRNHEFGIVLEVLRGNSESSSCQHTLVVAPRGRGKTMLLARVAVELRTDNELAKRLLPVRFMEESQEISGIADFWLETLFHLARESAGHDPNLAREMRETYAALSSRWRENGLHEHARAAVLSAADRLGRKLVLMVENLQALCATVDRDFGWQLRAVLQSEPMIILLASATSRFEGLDDAEQPFFELFRIVDLKPLATEDCQRLWRSVSGDTVTGRKIRPLEILTGGNPRWLVIVAGFARHQSLRRLMEELVVLIDEHNEYFRSNLEALPKSERRVYIAVIDLWQASTTGEIADRARMDVRIVSTMLGRLVERGAVVSDPIEGGRKRRYAAAERLYSIYYKLRRERDEAVIVRNLIHFMTAFYSESELAGIYGQMFVEAEKSPVIRAGIERALIEVPQFVGTLLGVEGSSVEPLIDQSEAIQQTTARRFKEEIDAAFFGGNWKRVVDIADNALVIPSTERPGIPDSLIAWIATRKAYALDELGDAKAAIATYNEVIERFDRSESPLCQKQVVISVVCRRVLQENVTQSQADIMIHDEMVERMGASSVPDDLRARVAQALFNEAALRNQRGDFEGAIEGYDNVIRRFGVREVQSLEMKALVARALVDKGITRAKSGESRAAIESYDEVLQCFGSDHAPDLQVEVARALFNTGVAQGQLGMPEAAIATYDEVLERFGAIQTLEFQVEVARAVFNKGNMQRQLGDPRMAIVAYDDVVERFGASEALDLQVPVARALCSKGTALEELGDTGAAIAVYNDAIERFGSNEAPELLGEVARSLFNLGHAHARRGNAEAAITAYDAVIERSETTNASDLQLPVAMALFGKGVTQAELGREREALRTSEELERRLDAMTGTAKAEFAWRAICLRTLALIAQKPFQAAMDTFRAAYATFPPGSETIMRAMLGLVQNLVANGVPENQIVQILSSDRKKSDLLAPLIVALRQRGGETVRAPVEVLEVAADVRRRIEAE